MYSQKDIENFYDGVKSYLSDKKDLEGLLDSFPLVFILLLAISGWNIPSVGGFCDEKSNTKQKSDDGV